MEVGTKRLERHARCRDIHEVPNKDAKVPKHREASAGFGVEKIERHYYRAKIGGTCE